MSVYKRGEIYYADLSPVLGSEQGGVRPVLIIQNDVGNKYSPTVIVCAVTSKITKAKLPTHVEIHAGQYGLAKDSVVLLEQMRTLDKRRLKARVGEVDETAMRKIERATLISLGFVSYSTYIANRSRYVVTVLYRVNVKSAFTLFYKLFIFKFLYSPQT